jgi:phosphoglycolate phosphatase
MRFRAILFDLDGTLVDHFAAIGRSHTHTMRQLGLPVASPARIKAAVGGGLDNALAQLVGPERVAEARPIYRAYWDATLLDDVVLLPGAVELLVALRAGGVRTAVLTNKLGSSARLVCDHLGLTPLLDTVVGAKDTPWLKPDPALTGRVLAQLGAEAATTLFVGDSPYDVATGHNAGLPVWCVITGTHTADQLRPAGADRVFAGLFEITAMLTS